VILTGKSHARKKNGDKNKPRRETREILMARERNSRKKISKRDNKSTRGKEGELGNSLNKFQSNARVHLKVCDRPRGR